MNATGTWIWLDGTPVTGPWQTDQPNGSTTERCLGYDAGSGDSGYSDFPCSLHAYYICQITDLTIPGIL